MAITIFHFKIFCKISCSHKSQEDAAALMLYVSFSRRTISAYIFHFHLKQFLLDCAQKGKDKNIQIEKDS